MQSIEVDALFKPTSASVRQLLVDMVGGFCIPMYQRAYRWGAADLQRLCEDMIGGIERLCQDASAVAFIGAVITVSGTGADDHATIPSDPRQVIDGQQRLTTLALLSMVLHEHLRDFEGAIDADQAISARARAWLLEHVSETRSQLVRCLYDEKAYGDQDYRRLPKIVRSHSDIWSNKAATARYASPIASIIHQYVKWNERGRFKPSTPTSKIDPATVGSAPEDFARLHAAHKELYELVLGAVRNAEPDRDLTLDVSQLTDSNARVFEALFPGQDKDDYQAVIQATEVSDDYLRALRLVLFARFMLERVVITQINAKDESYAFDLFDSLNTTGEPLTAFETFSPLVVQAEGAAYRTSPSFDHVSLVSRLLDASQTGLQERTAKLITNFVLAESGAKVGLKHVDQRKVLHSQYQSLGSLTAKRAMTRQLADCALCQFHLWSRAELSRGATGTVGNLSEESAFAIRFLSKINHSIVLAPLSRYYAHWVSQPTMENQQSLEAAILGMTAFSALWRGAHGGTDGIDGLYRSLMSEGLSVPTGRILAPLSRVERDTGKSRPLPNSEDLAAALRQLLAGSSKFPVTDRKSWISHAGARPVYEQRELSRFFLLVAGHHAVPDEDKGLTKDGAAADDTAMLLPGRYTSDDRLATVEHVAPQTPIPGQWDAAIYESPSAVSYLGNLTLLPLDDNSFVKNRSWTDKREIYRALAAESPDEADEVLKDAMASGLHISDDKREYIVDRRQHLPMLQSIATYSGTWDRQFIESRTKHLMNRTWSTLARWLGY